MAIRGKSTTVLVNTISVGRWRFCSLLILGLLTIASCVTIFALCVNRPYIGTRIEYGNGAWVVTYVDPGSLAAGSGIESGDLVIEADGQAAEQLAGKIIQPSSELRVISQEGQEKLVTASGSAVPTTAIFEPITFLIIDISLWSTGFFVFIKRAKSKQALLLYLLTLATGIAFITIPASARNVPGMRELQVTALILTSPLFLHFFLTFPKQKQTTFRNRSITPLIYLPAVILLILFASFCYKEHVFYPWFRSIVLVHLALGLLLGTISLLHSSLRADSYMIKQQGKIVLAGVSVAILPFFALSCIPELVSGSTLVPPHYSILGAIFVPLSIGYAILRYRLMDIDLVIRRGVVYGILLILLAAGYVFFAFVLNELLGPLSEVPRTLIIIAYGLLVILSFAAVKEKLQQSVDRRLFKDRYDYKQVVHSISASLTQFTDINLAARFITESIPRTLGLTGAYLALQSASGERAIMAKSGKFAFETDESLLALVQELKEEDLFPHLVPKYSGVAYFIPLKVKGRQVGLLCIGEKRVRVSFSHDDIAFLFTLSDQFGAAIESIMLATEVKEQAKKLEGSYRELQRYASSLETATTRLQEAYLKTVRTLVLTLEARDPYTRGHSERVARLARRIALELRLSAEEVERTELAARLHDLGKIGIPDGLLQKPGPLEPWEWAEVELHPTRSVEILRFLDFLEPVLPSIEAHHEWYNGSGYPNGLQGEEIPLAARILAVADAYDAMTSARPYRPAFTAAEIIEKFKQGAGVQWDPNIVEALLRLLLGQ